MLVQFPCLVCNRPVAKNHRAMHNHYIKYSKTQYETKPWIIPGLANSISKHKLTKASAKKDPKTKEYYEKQFKSYCNHISSMFRKTKDS